MQLSPKAGDNAAGKLCCFFQMYVFLMRYSNLSPSRISFLFSSSFLDFECCSVQFSFTFSLRPL